jgi:murein DD-endopeptidase MepM/ murein hydrolase activator NlpD
MPTLALPFKGTFPHTQGIGARPSVYAKYGLEGHDGDDWVMPWGTELYSPVNGKVLSTGNDPNSWGIFIQLWDPQQKILVNLAHLSSLAISQGQTVSKGQKVGTSGNTGFSEAPHLHVAVAFTDSAGNRQNTSNGFKGWFSILDSSRFTLENLGSPTQTQPTTPPSPSPTGQTTPAGVSFETAYPLIYPGWDRAGAQADFNLYGAKKWAEYQARQSSGSTSGAVSFDVAYPLIYPGWDRAGAQADFAKYGQEKWRQYQEQEAQKKNPPNYSNNPQGAWYIKPEYAGKSLRQIGDSGVQTGRTDILAGFLKLGEDELIPANKPITLENFHPSYLPSSSEFDGFQRVFHRTAPTPPAAQGSPEVSIIPPEEPGTGNPVVEPDIPTPPAQPQPPAQAPSTGQFGQILSKLDLILSRLSSTPNQPPAPGESTPSTQAGEGLLYISSEPAKASVYIDGIFIKDYTPFNTPISIGAGSYQLSIRKKDHIAYNETIQIQPNEQFTKHYILDPKP